MFRVRQVPHVEIELASAAELTHERVRTLFLDLRETRLSWLAKQNYVFRSLSHATTWAHGFVLTEANELDAEFVSSSKAYRVVVISDPEKKFAKIVFRLTTTGLDGWTQYGITVRKVGGYYACEE